MEPTARFSYVDCNSKEIRGGEEGNLTLGLNGYLSRHLQVMLNWIRARVKDRDTHPRVETGEADIYQARFQIAF
jgi:phosphate-selective porin